MKPKLETQLTELKKKHCKNITGALSGLKGALVIEIRKQKPDMLQEKIAAKLGTTQASISYYLHRLRGGASPLIENNAELKKEIKRIVREMI